MGITFPTNKGQLLINQLPTLTLTDLSISLKALKKQLKKEDDGDLDFLDDSKTVNKTLELQFEILKDVYLTKKEQSDTSKQLLETKQHNQKILALIAEKQEEGLKSMSEEELKKLLK